MPRFQRSKYSKDLNSELNFRVLDILANSQEAMNIDQIKNEDMILKDITSQKMARVLGNLNDMGLVAKAKSKSTNRMMYKSVGVMRAQGYDLED
jgi:predicted transcriptional regulator